MAHIHLLGTSHIAKKSINDVEKAFDKQNPSIVALELDKERLHALLNPQQKEKLRLKAIKDIGVKGWLFLALGAYVEKKLGKGVGVTPGDEMLAAFRLAQARGVKVALIDRNIRHTLRRLTGTLTWKEKWHFIVDLLKGLVGMNTVPFDPSSVPSKDVIQQLLKMLEPRYPSLYKVLVTERNEVMAAHLRRIALANPDSVVLAVVGAGHIDGIAQILARGTPATAG